MRLAIKGSGYTSASKTEIEFLNQVLIVVNDQGKIEKIINQHDDDYASLLQLAKSQKKLVELSENQYFLPEHLHSYHPVPDKPGCLLLHS